MATRKGICPYCNIARIENRIFTVNPEAAICFCPNCMREVEPSAAIKAYDDYIVSLIDKADESLFMKCDPEAAYQDYAKIIETDPTVVEGYLGRLLSMVYMSKIRSNYLKEVSILLGEEAEAYFLKTNVLDKFVPFLKKINRVVDEYYSVCARRLSYRDKYFYDVSCLTTFLRRVDEIYEFKSDILKYCMVMRRKYSHQTVEVLINLLEQSLDKLERLKERDFALASGVYFHLVEYKPDGEAVVEKVNNKKSASFNVLKKIRLHSLDPNAKGKKYINDVVFKNYTRVMKASKAAAFWYTFFFLLAAGAGVAAYFFFADKMVFYILVAAGALCLLLGIVFLSLRLSYKKIIKKRRAMFNQ